MRSIFPELPQDIPAQAAETVGRVPAFDADRGRFLLRDGALLERSGVEAVKQWFELALRQQIDLHPHLPHPGGEKIRRATGPDRREAAPGTGGGGIGTRCAGDRQL